jgi:hypothetical protein
MRSRVRRATPPAPGSRRNLRQLVEHLHLLLSVHCSDKSWWAHDIWDLRADPRIPQRGHEPCHDQTVKIGPIQPQWLREGLRFYLRTALTHDLLTWSSTTPAAPTWHGSSSPAARPTRGSRGYASVGQRQRRPLATLTTRG